MKRMLPRTVAGQLFAAAIVSLIVSQIIILVITVEDRQRFARQWWTNYVLLRITATTELLDHTPQRLHAQVLRSSDTRLLGFNITGQKPDLRSGTDETSVYRSELRAMVEKDASEVLMEARTVPWSEILAHWTAHWRGQPRPAAEPWLKAAVQIENGNWLNLDVKPFLRPPKAIHVLIPIITMLAVFGSTLIILIRHVTRPIKTLASAAEALGRGEDVKPIDASGPTEIRQATAAFNDMRERLSRFVLDRTRMLASVGHDLRTPITTMRLRAEFIEDEHIRERIFASLDEMQHMAEAALAFAREEASSEPTRMVDLNALIQTVCTDQADMDRPVAFHENGGLLYRCRPNSLKRAVRNIVENAVVHGSSAHVTMEDLPQGIVIAVDDDGPGIPEEKMPQMFLPFARLDEARGEETGGIGLGLAIARSIVRGHGGDIEIRNRKEGGLRATIQLPVDS